MVTRVRGLLRRARRVTKDRLRVAGAGRVMCETGQGTLSFELLQDRAMHRNAPDIGDRVLDGAAPKLVTEDDRSVFDANDAATRCPFDVGGLCVDESQLRLTGNERCELDDATGSGGE